MALLVGVLWLSACHKDAGVPGVNGPSYFDHAEFDPVSLAATVVSTAPAIGKPRLLRLTDGVLWIADMAGDPGLHALDAASGAPLMSLGRRGEGPGEFARSPFGLSVAPGDSAAIWAFDLSLQRLSRFETQSGDGKVTVVPLQGTPSILRIVWVSRDRLVGQSNSKDARFSLFSPDGRRHQTVPGALLGTDEQSEGLRLNATNSALQICEWPTRGFALVYFFAGRVEFHDHDASFVRVADAPYPSEPAFEKDPAGNALVSTARQWYIDCAATPDHLFALFSGRQRSAFEGDAAFSGAFVHVFDWTGALRRVLSLDKDVRAIAVDPSRRELYAASLVDAGIYRYPLPALSVTDRAPRQSATRGTTALPEPLREALRVSSRRVMLRRVVDGLSMGIVGLAALLVVARLALQRSGDGGMENAAFYDLLQSGQRMGSRSAPVQVLVYNDYQCGFCQELHATLETLRTRYPQHLAVVVKDFIDPAKLAHYKVPLGAHCAAEQGRFEAYHAAAFRHSRSSVTRRDGVFWLTPLRCRTP